METICARAANSEQRKVALRSMLQKLKFILCICVSAERSPSTTTAMLKQCFQRSILLLWYWMAIERNRNRARLKVLYAFNGIYTSNRIHTNGESVKKRKSNMFGNRLFSPDFLSSDRVCAEYIGIWRAVIYIFRQWFFMVFFAGIFCLTARRKWFLVHLHSTNKTIRWGCIASASV